MVSTAVIMAAGLGTRFGAMTETMPKGFIEAGGKAMVVRSIETLLACGISRIISSSAQVTTARHTKPSPPATGK